MSKQLITSPTPILLIPDAVPGEPITKARAKALEPTRIDVQMLASAQLKKRYVLEHTGYRNMRARCKGKYILCPEFETFEGFLFAMGPKPKKQHTNDGLIARYEAPTIVFGSAFP